MNDAVLQINCLTKRFDHITAVDRLNLAVHHGEILALVGPSGCGKTTLLRLIAGFEQPDEGEILLQGALAANGKGSIPPERRGVGMVFQDYALFPHLNVAQNVAFGLAGLPKYQRSAVIGQTLELVGLTGYDRRYPHELSGGERQRVALARALAPSPLVILLDEPFSNLDADRRLQVREDVHAILKKAGISAIFVTHDQEEALSIGDRLAVLNKGRLEQVGEPEEVFHTPASRFVAVFMGQTDFLPAQVVPAGILTEVGLLHQPVDLPPGSMVEIALRADDVSFRPGASSGAVIQSRQFKGAVNLYCLRLPSGRTLHSLQPHTCLFQPGTGVDVRIEPGHALAYFNRDDEALPPGVQPETVSHQRDVDRGAGEHFPVFLEA